MGRDLIVYWGTPMHTGKVKWFNNAKGFGFIISDSHDEDLFAHYSVIQVDGYKSLKAGQEVQFETTPGPKGTHAINIRPVLEEATEENE
jgi:CspA family cold shock protein